MALFASPTVTIADDDAPRSRLSFASQAYRVDEGASVTLTVNISPPLASPDAVVVAWGEAAYVRHLHDSDYTVGGMTRVGADQFWLELPANVSSATFTLAAVADRLTEGDETSTFVLRNRPRYHYSPPPYDVAAGARSSSTAMTIVDTSTFPGIRLSAAPNPVAEGSPVTVTATLPAALAKDVTIRLRVIRGVTATLSDALMAEEPRTVTRGMSEDGDHGTLASIMVPAGGTSASGTIATSVDEDGDDEMFTVAVDGYSVPPGLSAGTLAVVQVTITDNGAQQQRREPQTAETPEERTPPEEASQTAQPEPEAPQTATAGGPLSGLALTAGSQAVALVPAFSPGVTRYRAEVPAGTREVSLAPSWGAAAERGGSPTVWARSRRPVPHLTLLSRQRVGASGTAAALSLSPDGPTRLEVVVSEPGLRTTDYRIAVVEAAAAQTVTVAFGAVPPEHDGRTAFALEVQSGSEPAAAAFTVTNGKVTGVESLDPVLWRVRVKPKSWKDVTVALGEASATVRGPARIRVADARAKEGKDASLDFAVSLSRAASGPVSVDYATKDGTAAAGADYTAASGTLVFAVGETEKTVSVALLDDAIDEGKETFKLKLSNLRGAFLRKQHREAEGVIKNDDPLQAMWLARFGRMVASDAVGAVTARFDTPRDAGSHLTFAGQRLDLSGEGAGDGQALANAVTGLARAFGAEVTAADDDPFAHHGLSNGWNDSTTTAPHAMTGRELLLGTSFRAVLGQGAGSQWTSWGQGASVSQFSAAVPGLSLTGESATGSMGMDYERGRLLAGFAMTHSVGEGTAHDAEWRYALGSTATMMVPYGRFALTERLSAWTLAGTGAGTLTLDLDGAVAQRYRTDLAMTLAAAGVRGDLLTPEAAGGFALALKADAFWARTESDRVTASRFGGLMDARGESSRVRAMLDGSRTFSLAGGATLAPSVALGVRHDGGDAETGTGLELGAGLGYADPSRGLDMALRVHGIAAHAEDGYDEWGVSGQLRLVPGAAGRGLSMSLTPSYGADPGGSERLWALPDAHALAAHGDAPASSRLDTEFGYGLPVFGGGFTGTPNVGLGLSDTARDLRLGWRLSPAAASGDTGFELSVDATRRESAEDGDTEHGVMLRSRLRW